MAAWDLLRRLGLTDAESRLIVLALHFTTPLWFTSRLFFTEAYTVSVLVLALWLLERRRIVAASLLLGVAFWLKETNVLLILPVLAGTWVVRGRRAAAGLALGPLAAFALWAGKNLLLYDEPLVTFQRFQLGGPDRRHDRPDDRSPARTPALRPGARRGARRGRTPGSERRRGESGRDLVAGRLPGDLRPDGLLDGLGRRLELRPPACSCR